MKPLHSVRSSKLSLHGQVNKKIIVSSHLHPGKTRNSVTKQNFQNSRICQTQRSFNLFATSCGSSIRHFSASTPNSAEKSSSQNDSEQKAQTQTQPRKNLLTIETAYETRRAVLRCLPTGSGYSGLQMICKTPTLPAQKKFAPITMYYQQALRHILPIFGYTDPNTMIKDYGADYMEILSTIPESAYVVEEDTSDLIEYEKKIRQADYQQRKILLEDKDIFMFFAKILGFPRPTYQYLTLAKARLLTIGLDHHFQQQSTQMVFVSANQKLEELARHGRDKQVQVEMMKQMAKDPEFSKLTPQQLKQKFDELASKLPSSTMLGLEKRQEIIMNYIKEVEVKYLQSFEELPLRGDNGWYNFKFSLLSYSSDPTVALSVKSFTKSIASYLPMDVPQKPQQQKQESSEPQLVPGGLME